MHHSIRLLPVALLVVACGAPVSTVDPTSDRPVELGCPVLPDSAGLRADILTVGLTGAVSPAALPSAADPDLALVSRQLFEPLIRVDCLGRALPGTARHWHRSRDGRTWAFLLDSAARFSDGTPVTAEDVLRSWAVSYGRRNRREPADSPWSWFHPDSVAVLPTGELQVSLVRPAGEDPLLFAHASLAVFKAGDPWPVGTGPFRVLQAAPDVLVLGGNPHYPGPIREGLELRFLRRTGADPRDLLAEGVDLLQVRVRSHVEYASGSDEYHLAPLPWSRLLLLNAPAAVITDEVVDADEAILRAELAHEVAMTPARPAAEFVFETSPHDCPGELFPAAPKDPGRRTRTVAFDPEDPDAAEIAARIVAVANAPGTTPPFGLSPGTYSARSAPLGNGSAGLRVVGCRNTFPDPCLVLAALADDLRAGESTRLIPLVATRVYLVHRPGIGGVSADWDGTPLLARAGRGRAPVVP